MRTIRASELVLVDSNILIYATQAEAPQYLAAKTVRDQGLTGRISACISPQVLAEFFAVVTNPKRVSAPLTRDEAIAEVKKYHQAKKLVKVYPGTHIVRRMLSLLERYKVTGIHIHDLHLVATMLENGVKNVYTFNTKEFALFSEIETYEPPALSVDAPS